MLVDPSVVFGTGRIGRSDFVEHLAWTVFLGGVTRIVNVCSAGGVESAWAGDGGHVSGVCVV